MVPKICVVGAGIVGLSCAFKLNEEFQGAVQLTIIADSFLDETTSFECGGLWEPYQIASTDDKKIYEWGRISFEHFAELYASKDAEAAGVQLMTCYKLRDSKQELVIPTWQDIVINFTLLSTADLLKLGVPRRFIKGCSFDTFVVDQKYYLRYMMEKLKEIGAKFIRHKLESIEELRPHPGENGGGFDIVVNCAGLGAGSLLADQCFCLELGQRDILTPPWHRFSPRRSSCSSRAGTGCSSQVRAPTPLICLLDAYGQGSVDDERLDLRPALHHPQRGHGRAGRHGAGTSWSLRTSPARLGSRGRGGEGGEGPARRDGSTPPRLPPRASPRLMAAAVMGRRRRRRRARAARRLEHGAEAGGDRLHPRRCRRRLPGPRLRPCGGCRRPRWWDSFDS